MIDERSIVRPYRARTLDAYLHGQEALSRQVPIVRAAHLIDYIDVLRDLGTPVERDLERSRLPPVIEYTPDL